LRFGRFNIGEGKSNTQQAFWVVIGSLSSFSLAIISSAILSRYFSKQEYGTYKQIIYIYTTLLIIFTAGLPEVFAYFLPRYSINEGRAIVRKITRTLFLSGAVFSVFLYTASGLIAVLLNNSELERGIKAFSPIPFLLLPTLGIEGIFSTYKKTIFIGIYNTLTRFLMLLFMVLPVVIFKGSYLTAIYGWVIVSFISLIIAFYFKGIPFKHVESKEASLAYKKIFAYSLPLVSASLWGIAIRSADQFYISRFFGPTIFAEFSNGFIQLPLVSMVTGATSVVLMPVFSKMVNDKSGLHELIAVWRSALIKSATIIYPVVLFFMFFANDIIIILFSKAYEPSTIYFQINMALNFFNIIVFAPLLFSLGKTKIYARIHMFLAVAVWLFEYLVILLFASAIAVAIVSVSLGILNVIIGVVYIAKILQINLLDLIPYKEIIKIVFHALMVAIFVKFGLSFFNLSSPLTELLLAFITFCLILLSSSRFFNLNYLSFIKPLLIKSKFLKSEV
jgi:O-antigen/teichoic acid export membrane protein